MKILKKGLLAAAVAALALVGTAVVPAPSHAASAGSLEFVGTFGAPPVGLPLTHNPAGGSANFSSFACAETSATTAALPDVPLCSIWAGGEFGNTSIGVGGYCNLAGGTMNGGFRLGNGQEYGFNITYNLVSGVFSATGSARSWNTGESGVFTVNGVVAQDPGTAYDYNCLKTTLTRYHIVGTAQFQTL